MDDTTLEAGSYVAVLDRFETLGDGTRLAVLVVESDGDDVAQLDVPTAMVPDAGRHADAVFALVVRDDEVRLRHRPGDTDERAESARARFDRLARRPPSRREE